jgi:aerobic carbon-monoxide dehydrogenase large subunit
METPSGPYVGHSAPSYKGRAIVTGSVRYTADHVFPGQLHACILRSPHASARIRSVDLSAATRVHGVVLALDGRAVARQLDPVPHYCDPAVVGGHSLPIHCLAVEDVHFEGHPVAVVVAEDRAAALEAAARVRIDYEIRPAVIDTERALKADAPLVVPAWGTNAMVSVPFVDGDCDEAFRQAHRVLKARLKLHRYSTQPIETRAYNAVWDAEEQMVTLHATVQSPHALRHFLSRTLRMPENRIRVVAPHPGGSFGLKMHGHPEEALVCLLARLSRRPVRWVETREECLLIGSREQVHEIEVAVAADGRFLAVRDRFLANVGAPSATAGWCMAYLTGLTMPGPYAIPNLDVQMQAVVTNKAPWNAARGYGKEATAIALEFMMDKAARELGLDPAEIRLRNFIPSTAFPCKTPTGLILDSGDYVGATRKALAEIGYQGFRQRQAQARQQGRLLGIGIGYEVVPEGGALPGTFFSGFDTATVKLDPAGFVTVTTGVTDPGTGNAIGIAQIVADELGVPLGHVRVVQGDTETCPYGVGNYSGRSIIVGGGAAALSARSIRSMVAKVAGAMFEVPEDSIRIAAGRVTTSARPDKSATLGEVSFIAHTHANDIAACIQPPLEVTSTCKPDWIRHTPDEKGRLNSYTSYANGAYAAIVEIDPDTGVVRVERITVAHDCGKVINPSLVEGQVSGAVAFAIGGMLSEEQAYGDGGRMLTRDFGDYVMPRALDVPEIAMQHHDVPNPVTLYGVKGAGESGLGGTAAALINAVNDALAHLGVEITEYPLSAPNIWKALAAARTRQAEPHEEVVS